jgi:anti-anti-sigma factor
VNRTDSATVLLNPVQVTQSEGGVTVVSFRRPPTANGPGLVDADQVRTFFTRDFQGMTAKASRLVVDLAGVSLLDSASLGPLIQRMGDIQKNRGRMVLTGVDAPGLRQVLAMTRFDKVFTIVPTREAAIAVVTGTATRI